MKNILFVVLILANSVYSSYAGLENFDHFHKRIIEKLDSIETYEMNVLFSEALTSAESDFSDFYDLFFKVIEETGGFKDLNIQNSEELKKLVDLKSICKMSVKYKKPNRLYIDANSNFMTQGRGGHGVQMMRIYTTFDGAHQKARSSIEFNGKKNVKSIIMDLSINGTERPFDGWNLKGFGFSQGSDYIGTVKGLLYQYDFKFLNRKDNIITFSGTLNKERMIAAYPKSIPIEAAKGLVEMEAAVEKSFNIEFDTNRDLIIGYFGEYNSTFNTVKKICIFKDININSEIKGDVFSYISLPHEKFTDITDLVRNSRKLDKLD
jgi:hypothetical protein